MRVFEKLSGQNAMTSPVEIQMSNQGSSGSAISSQAHHSYSFIPSKSNAGRNAHRYAHSTQGTQGLQVEKPTNIKKLI